MTIPPPNLPEEFLAAVCKEPVQLKSQDLHAMLALVRSLNRLGANPAYRETIAPTLPAAARFDPGHSSVMMGYDFHLTDVGPRLIEVNTNAGGGLLPLLAASGRNEISPKLLHPAQHRKLVGSFLEDFRGFRRDSQARPTSIAIIDENPAQQFLYPEMCAFAELFRSTGIPAEILAPEQLSYTADGVFHGGRRIDLIYNRHCDFYLQSPAMARLCNAYLQKQVCLTPNPWVYGLLADKRRLALFSDAEQLRRLNVSEQGIALLTRIVPKSRLLADCVLDEVWTSRKELVFKPLSLFASRGVLLGKSISRKRFDELPVEQTLVQDFVSPSQIQLTDGSSLKADFRLFAYRNRIIGVAARLYQGQVTNLRTPGGGFAAVKFIG